jgi:hypothetical protein
MGFYVLMRGSLTGYVQKMVALTTPDHAFGLICPLLSKGGEPAAQALGNVVNV